MENNRISEQSMRDLFGDYGNEPMSEVQTCLLAYYFKLSGCSSRDMEAMFAEAGSKSSHTTISGWVNRGEKYFQELKLILSLVEEKISEKNIKVIPENILRAMLRDGGVPESRMDEALEECRSVSLENARLKNDKGGGK